MSNHFMSLAVFAGVAASFLACSGEATEPSNRPMTGSTGGSAGTASTTGGTGTGGMATGGTFGTGGSSGSLGTGGTGGSTGGTGGSTGGTGGSTTTNPCKAAGIEKALPMTVDDAFIPSGYFAGPLQGMDPEPNIMGIVEGTCDTPPEPATSVGSCHKFTFQAALLSEGTEENPAGAYGGVFWQAPANNWGTGPGIKVAAGATKVTFRAWSDTAETVVSFNAGGISGVCSDNVQLGATGTEITLSDTPTEYEVTLAGQTYPDGVIGGFVWSAAVEDLETVVTVYIDDVQWVGN
jgi:hypothetical protein